MRHLIIAAAFAIFAVLTSSSHAFEDPTVASVSGDWRGSLNAGGTILHIVFHLTATPTGALTATFDSVDQGANGIPFSSASFAGTSVTLEAEKIGARFQGKLDEQATTITGTWSQSGHAMPVTLTRVAIGTGPGSAAPVAAEAALPPPPYDVRDVSFPGGAAGVTLAATLTTPKGAGPFPAAVLICGSGPHDRDETIFGHKPFALLADTLTRRGIAVLRYDKRGIAKSTGSYATATTVDFAKDAEAAVAFLETQPAIDRKRIGLIGHSEGGLIAPMVASRDRAIAFVVLMAGPGMNGEKIMLAQSALINKAEGASAAQIARNTQLQEGLFAIVKRESDLEVVQKQAEALVLKSLDGLTPRRRRPSVIQKPLPPRKAAPWRRPGCGTSSPTTRFRH